MKFSNTEKMFFYLNSEWKSPIFTMYFDFSKDVNIDKFKEAVRRSLVIFPRMKSMPVLDAAGFVKIVENTDEVPVFEDCKTSQMLGSEQSNYYMFRWAIHKNKLTYSMFHALSDYTVTAEFLRQTFLNYLDLIGGYDVKELLLTEDEVCKKEYTELLTDKAEEYLKNHEGCFRENAPEMPKAFFANENAEYIFSDSNFVQVLSWDAKALKDVLGRFQITPLVLFHTLLARANVEIYNPEEDVIRCDFAIDLRSRLGSRSHTNFCGEATLLYDKNWAFCPVEEQFKLVQKSLTAAVDMDDIVSDIIRQSKSEEYIINNIKPGSEFMKKALAAKFDRSEATYFISNIGKIDLCQDKFDYLDSFMVIPTTFFNSVDYYLMTFKDTGQIVEVKNNGSTAVLEKVREKLAMLGIDTQLKTTLHTPNRMDVSLFKREDEKR